MSQEPPSINIGPPWDKIPWKNITLYYPGQVTWEWLISSSHAGAPDVLNGQGCAECHTPALMGKHSVEHELRDDLQGQWKMMVFSGFIFVLGLGIAGVLVARRND